MHVDQVNAIRAFDADHRPGRDRSMGQNVADAWRPSMNHSLSLCQVRACERTVLRCLSIHCRTRPKGDSTGCCLFSMMSASLLVRAPSLKDGKKGAKTPFEKPAAVCGRTGGTLAMMGAAPGSQSQKNAKRTALSRLFAYKMAVEELAVACPDPLHVLHAEKQLLPFSYRTLNAGAIGDFVQRKWDGSAGRSHRGCAGNTAPDRINRLQAAGKWFGPLGIKQSL